MSPTELIILIAVFIAPIAYQRIHFIYKRSHFEKLSGVREKSGLQIHHAHWGILFLFITTIYTLFWGNDIYSIIGFGYSWGLIADEIIPHLKTPSTDREAELKIYSAARKPTLKLVSMAIILFVILYLVS